MQSAFPKISKIKFEGPKSKNPLAFKHYNPDEIVEGKSMKDQLRFSAVYWHTMRGMGSDMFGVGTMQRPWEDGTNSVKMALKRVPVMFEFCQKLGVPYYAFHDRDVAPEGRNLGESNKNLDVVAKELKKFQKDTGIKLETLYVAYTTCVPPIHQKVLGKILFGKMLNAVYPNIGPHKNMNHTASGLYLLR